MISAASALGIILALSPPYPCGHKETMRRPYGKVELRVDCRYKGMNSISLLEFRKGKQHGIQMDFDSLWRKKDSLQFRDGKEHGQAVYWDTLGNVIGRQSYIQGVLTGPAEFFYSPGRPSLRKTYDTRGKAQGRWEEWWPNGNRKADFMARNGEIVSATEYYPDGKPRVRYITAYQPEETSVFKMKRIEAEGWAPNGKPTGSIAKGNGEWIVFHAEPDSVTHRYPAFHETYKDSLLIKVEPLDSLEMPKWLK